LPALDACRKRGSSSATFPKWQANFKGLAVSNTKRLEAQGAPSAPLIHKPTFADSFALTSIAGYTMPGIGDIAIG
jgi:hypothetical protein